MIDLFSINIEINHTPFGAIRDKKPENGEVITKQFTKTLYINHVPVFVTSRNNGTQINIRCCPLKVIQGHNVFGTNNLNKLWNYLIDEVLKLLSIKPTTTQLKEWKRGQFEIEEIHITHRFPVESYQMVRKAITHIKRYTSEDMAPSSLRKGTGVTLSAPHGKASWIVYDKHQEFGDKRTKEQKYLYAVARGSAKEVEKRLSRSTSKSIRAEIKLSKGYLKAHGLNRGDAWTSRKAIEIFAQELSLLSLGKLPALPDLPKFYGEIDDPKLRSIVILWANGECINDHYASASLRKYRKEIRAKLGMDILKDQPVLETASINLSEIFGPGKMLTGFPKWTRAYPEIALR